MLSRCPRPRVQGAQYHKGPQPLCLQTGLCGYSGICPLCSPLLQGLGSAIGATEHMLPLLGCRREVDTAPQRFAERLGDPRLPCSRPGACRSQGPVPLLSLDISRVSWFPLTELYMPGGLGGSSSAERGRHLPCQGPCSPRAISSLSHGSPDSLMPAVVTCLTPSAYGVRSFGGFLPK